MKKKILIVVGNYYKKITNNLVIDAINKLPVKKYKIRIVKVSGAFEIPVIISKNIKRYDGFIALGCVIKGKTPHFDFLCNATFNALMNLSIIHKKPIGNGIITCLNKKQAIQRSLKKGSESALAIKEILSL